MKPLETNRRHRTRSRARGAAMVEGIVVITTMLVFLGMNVWVTKAYGGKLDQANSTRRDVLYYASHNCEEQNGSDPDTYITEGARGSAGQGASTEAADPGVEEEGQTERLGGYLEGATGGGESAALKRTASMATAEKGPTSVTGSAIVNATPERGINLTRPMLTTRIATKSWSVCNEKRYDSQWSGFFEYGWGFIKGAGGLL